MLLKIGLSKRSHFCSFARQYSTVGQRTFTKRLTLQLLLKSTKLWISDFLCYYRDDWKCTYLYANVLFARLTLICFRRSVMIMTMYIIVQKYCSFSTKMYLSYEIRNNSNYDDFTLHSRRIMICSKIWLIELFAKVFELLPCIAYVIRNRFESSCYWVVRKVSFVSRGNNRRFLFYIILSNYVRCMLFYRDKHRDILQTWFHVCMKVHCCKRHFPDNLIYWLNVRRICEYT